MERKTNCYAIVDVIFPLFFLLFPPIWKRILSIRVSNKPSRAFQSTLRRIRSSWLTMDTRRMAENELRMVETTIKNVCNYICCHQFCWGEIVWWKQISYLMGFCWIDIVKPPKRWSRNREEWRQISNIRWTSKWWYEADIHTYKRLILGEGKETRKNLLNKLKKASAIYSQFEAYQFHSAFRNIIKLNQFSFSSAPKRFFHVTLMNWNRSRMCAFFSPHKKKRKNEIKLNQASSLSDFY